MTNLRRGADGEGQPLVSSDGEDVDEDPVAGVKVELGLALHHHDQACHVGGKDVGVERNMKQRDPVNSRTS